MASKTKVLGTSDYSTLRRGRGIHLGMLDQGQTLAQHSLFPTQEVTV